MKVIVNVSGFYGGTWYDEENDPQDMPDAIAKAFLPPHGDQLALPPARKAAPAVAVPADEKKPARAASASKEDARKAD
jgi:hypothetical protein